MCEEKEKRVQRCSDPAKAGTRNRQHRLDVVAIAQWLVHRSVAPRTRVRIPLATPFGPYLNLSWFECRLDGVTVTPKHRSSSHKDGLVCYLGIY